MVFPRGLYGMADATYGDPWPQACLLAEAGVGILQLRCKGWPTAPLAELAIRVRALGPIVVVNDDVEAARRAGAWVHLGQEDGDTELVHGRSTHELAEVLRERRAAYLGFGPVFPTATKRPRHPPRGSAMLAEAVRASPLPVVAIGGIGPENLDEVRATGVHAWAVVGAIWTAPRPREIIAALR